MLDFDLDWDDYSHLQKRKCKTCGVEVELSSQWWDFVSSNCEHCEYKEFEA